MILVRTNPKLALIIVLLTLATSIFTVWMVTRTTDKVAQQGIELQREANRSVNDAIEKSNAAASRSGASDDVQAQLDAAQQQLDAATK
jgi:hypothetical protein